LVWYQAGSGRFDGDPWVDRNSRYGVVKGYRE
jgi:hypothetical protein